MIKAIAAFGLFNLWISLLSLLAFVPTSWIGENWKDRIEKYFCRYIYVACGGVFILVNWYFITILLAD